MPVTNPGMQQKGHILSYCTGWRDGIQIKEEIYAQTTSAQSVSEKARLSRCSRVYNTTKGRVSHLNEHEWKNMLLIHKCQYCFTQNNRVETQPKKIAGGAL